MYIVENNDQADSMHNVRTDDVITLSLSEQSSGETMNYIQARQKLFWSIKFY